MAYWGPKNENFDTFIKIASVTDDAVFVHNFDYASFASKPSVVVYKNFEEEDAVYSGDLADAESLQSFIGMESLPLIMDFDQKAAQAIFSL